MTLTRSVLWRFAASVLWVTSLICLGKAIIDGVYAEEGLYNPNLTAADRLGLHQLNVTADRWSAVGWILQAATATTLALGVNSKRVVRRIFVALGLVIAVDGITLLMTVLVLSFIGR